jgi:hypothetical protein
MQCHMCTSIGVKRYSCGKFDSIICMVYYQRYKVSSCMRPSWYCNGGMRGGRKEDGEAQWLAEHGQGMVARVQRAWAGHVGQLGSGSS